MQDPFYEYYKDDRGKQKRRKRNPPPGLTPHEEKVWRKIAKHAHRLDRGIRICGFRFGYTAILGIFPYVGTAANAGLNYYLVTKPAKEHFEYVQTDMSCSLPPVPVFSPRLSTLVATLSSMASLLCPSFNKKKRKIGRPSRFRLFIWYPIVLTNRADISHVL